MPHGTPDWWGESPTSTIHQVTDAGELAVRLGSPVTNDRRGNVVRVNGFESGLKAWITSYVGAGGGVVLSTKACQTGAYSAKFTTGQDPAGNAALSKYHPLLVLGKAGLEVSFASASASPTIRVRFYYYDGAQYHLFSVRYDYPNQRFQYLDNAAAWQNIDTGLLFYPSITSWNFLKLVVDLSGKDYERVILNDNEYSLQGIDALSVNAFTAPYLSTVLFADGDNAGNYVVYFDDVIWTQNEP